MTDDLSQNVIGSGLIALDLILSEGEVLPARANVLAGGSCGNVLTILAYLGWNSFPIAQLSDNPASELLCQDMHRWGVNTRFLTISNQGITPVIIHRVYQSTAKHRFEFKNPQTKAWLPRFRPISQRYVKTIVGELPRPAVFYFDRVSPATLILANECRKQGSLIVFEPSSIKDEDLFNKALAISHVIKFSQERIPTYKDLYPNSQVLLEIQTLGNNGITYRSAKNGNAWHELPAYSIEGIVDTAGAGDWCTAGIINTLLVHNLNFERLTRSMIEHALKVGQSMGAINCCFIGARGVMYVMAVEQLKELVFNMVTDSGKFKMNERSFNFTYPNVDIYDRVSCIGYEELLHR